MELLFFSFLPSSRSPPPPFGFLRLGPAYGALTVLGCTAQATFNTEAILLPASDPRGLGL